MIFVPGTIKGIRCYDSQTDTEHVEWDWEGGPILDVTWPLLYQVNPKYVWWEGKRLTMGPYKLQLLERQPQKEIDRFANTDWPFWRVILLWYKITSWLRKASDA